jgi:hypothetical protein
LDKFALLGEGQKKVLKTQKKQKILKKKKVWKKKNFRHFNYVNLLIFKIAKLGVDFALFFFGPIDP